MNHPLHPVMVHFPIALLSTAALFLVLELFMKRDFFDQAASWLLGLGFLAALAATGSGLLAEEAAEEGGVPEAAIELHETFAFATIAAFAVIVLVRWLQRSGRLKLPPAAMAVIGLLGAVLIGVTGYFGGDLVYRYGAGVDQSTVKTLSAPAHDESD